jgi:hypothetical protein
MGEFLEVMSNRTMVKKCVMMNVKFLPDLCCNLFSIVAALKKNWKLSNNGDTLI